MRPSVYSLVLLVSILSAIQLVTGQAGLTFDLCNSTSSCAGTRKCYDTSTSEFSECSEATVSDCVCYPDEPTFCSSSDQCDDGEICARTEDTPSSCYSEQAVDSNDKLFEFDSPPSPIPIPSGESVPPLWENVGTIQRGQPCAKPLQCTTGLFCLSFSSPSCQGRNDNCRCVPSGSGTECGSDGDCSNDDVCVQINGNRLQNACLPTDISTVVSPFPILPTVTPVPVTQTPFPSASSLSDASLAPSSAPSLIPPSSSSVPASTSEMPETSMIDNVPSPEPITTTGIDPSSTPVTVPTDIVSVPSPIEGEGETTDDGTESTNEDTGTETDEEPSSSEDITDTDTDETSSPLMENDISTSISPMVSPDGTTSINDDSNPEPSTSAEVTVENAICISVEHLSHVSKSDLVYTNHKHAKVLCDMDSSCATPGHMVLYKNSPMMMRTYCDLVHVHCRSMNKLVNNVRYNNNGNSNINIYRINSRSKHLVFTALAARFNTNVEELVLKQLIHMGF